MLSCQLNGWKEMIDVFTLEGRSQRSSFGAEAVQWPLGGLPPALLTQCMGSLGTGGIGYACAGAAWAAWVSHGNKVTWTD